MTQKIAVEFENVNTLTSQLRAAGAAIKVSKGSNTFNITITKQPTLATIEEILTGSKPSELKNISSTSVQEFTIEKIAVPLEKLENSNIIAKKPFSSPKEIVYLTKIANISLLKQEVKDGSAFVDDDDSIPF
jgi:hypothetical protein